jgi:hypothetical protein
VLNPPFIFEQKRRPEVAVIMASSDEEDIRLEEKLKIKIGE